MVDHWPRVIVDHHCCIWQVSEEIRAKIISLVDHINRIKTYLMPRNCWNGNMACCCCWRCCRFISSRAAGETNGKADANRCAFRALSWWFWLVIAGMGGLIGFVIEETPVDELAVVIGLERFWSFSLVSDSSTLSMLPLWAKITIYKGDRKKLKVYNWKVTLPSFCQNMSSMTKSSYAN